MIFSLRILTILCYFLPFTFFLATCNGPSLVMCYNQKEADSYKITEKESLRNLQDASFGTTLYLTEVATDTTSKDSERQSISDKIIKQIIFPTDNSTSGIGSIVLHRNL